MSTAGLPLTEQDIRESLIPKARKLGMSRADLLDILAPGPRGLGINYLAEQRRREIERIFAEEWPVAS